MSQLSESKTNLPSFDQPMNGVGGFATHACVNAQLVLPLPTGFAFDDAAAFICTYGTSHHALIDRAQLKAGETVLVLGAAGGVGTAAIQIAKTVGARVIDHRLDEP